jgi:acyl-CoA thioesterase-1
MILQSFLLPKASTMPRRNVCLSVLALLLLAAPTTAQDGPTNPAFDPVEDDPSLPRVLLLGDSISIGYTPAVREFLAGKANVHRAMTNCGPTTKGLAELDVWLGDKSWDVIHFNFGLHDLKYMDPSGNLVPVDQGRQQVSLDDYRKNLQELVQRLRATGATLIWASTTPVPMGAQGRVADDAFLYNAVAAEVMHAGGEEPIAINDLHGVAFERLERILQTAKVHFTDEVSRLLG